MIYRAVLTHQSMHSRSVLGVLWEPLLVLISAFVLATVWSIVMGDGDFNNYFAYICIGLGVWGFISKSVIRSASYIDKYSHSIANSRYPLLSYVVTEVLFCAIIFIVVLPFLVGVSIYYNGFSFPALFISCIGTLFIFLAGVGFGMLVGSISAFLPDIREIITAIMRIAFLVTPIIWKPERLGEHDRFLIFNPFYPYIEMIRTPLLGGEVSNTTFLLVVSITVVLLLLGFTVLSLCNKQIRFKVV